MKIPAAAAKLAEYALEVRRKGPMALATNFGSTLSGQDGGYAVPIDTAAEIVMQPAGALLSLCSEVPVARAGGIGIPVDACSPWTDGGIVAYWSDEGDELTSAKPRLELTNFRLKKLTCLVPVSEELLEDAAALAAWLPLAMSEAIKQKVNAAIVAGPGAGRPLGILNAPGTITVDAEVSQSDGTLNAANVAKMLERHIDPTRAMWLLNPGAYGQAVTTGLFTSASGLWDNASRTLAGLPIFLTDACSSLGSRGDIILADMAGYVVASKAAQMAQSLHLWFDQDIAAFRLIFRFDGAPMLSAPVTPPNSLASKSNFVTLAART